MQPAQSLPEPAEHFDSVERQDQAAHLGMWLFLTSEVLLFGALFGVYTAVRAQYGQPFHEAAHHNDAVLGTANTFILITSSFLAAWAVHAVRLAHARTALASIGATILLGLAFLTLKALEYRDHFAHGIYPGAHYRFAELPGDGAKLFYTLYYTMTGLHALHVIGGLIALAVVLVQQARGRYSAHHHTSLELTVLYWHLVDVIWIFLWPLMYLVA